MGFDHTLTLWDAVAIAILVAIAMDTLFFTFILWRILRVDDRVNELLRESRMSTLAREKMLKDIKDAADILAIQNRQALEATTNAIDENTRITLQQQGGDAKP